MKKGTNKVAVFVVIVILLIFLGVILFFGSTNKKGEKEDVNLSKEEIEEINENFLSYEGSRNGKQVQKLLEILVEYNKSADENKQVDLKANTIQNTKGDVLSLGETDGKYIVLRNKDVLGPNKLYKISFEKASNGRIKLIKIGV